MKLPIRSSQPSRRSPLPKQCVSACKPALFAASLLLAISAGAEYALDWSKIAGGGGSSTGSVYAVSGTIGQADAGGPMTNGQYALTGGFWALPELVQSTDAPTLHITRAAVGQATIWWTPTNSPGYTLQFTDSFAPTNWLNAPSGTNNPATVPATLPKRFYRLIKP